MVIGLHSIVVAVKAVAVYFYWQIVKFDEPDEMFALVYTDQTSAGNKSTALYQYTITLIYPTTIETSMEKQ